MIMIPNGEERQQTHWGQWVVAAESWNESRASLSMVLSDGFGHGGQARPLSF